jgi:hypothetical protein
MSKAVTVERVLHLWFAFRDASRELHIRRERAEDTRSASDRLAAICGQLASAIARNLFGVQGVANLVLWLRQCAVTPTDVLARNAGTMREFARVVCMLRDGSIQDIGAAPQVANLTGEQRRGVLEVAFRRLNTEQVVTRLYVWDVATTAVAHVLADVLFQPNDMAEGVDHVVLCRLVAADELRGPRSWGLDPTALLQCARACLDDAQAPARECIQRLIGTLETHPNVVAAAAAAAQADE